MKKIITIVCAAVIVLAVIVFAMNRRTAEEYTVVQRTCVEWQELGECPLHWTCAQWLADGTCPRDIEGVRCAQLIEEGRCPVRWTCTELIERGLCPLY